MQHDRRAAAVAGTQRTNFVRLSLRTAAGTPEKQVFLAERMLLSMPKPIRPCRQRYRFSSAFRSLPCSLKRWRLRAPGVGTFEFHGEMTRNCTQRVQSLAQIPPGGPRVMFSFPSMITCDFFSPDLITPAGAITSHNLNLFRAVASYLRHSDCFSPRAKGSC